jgi:hypothetical protein
VYVSPFVLLLPSLPSVDLVHIRRFPASRHS